MLGEKHVIVYSIDDALTSLRASGNHLTIYRPSTSKAIGYCPRHNFQPHCLSCNPHSSIWRNVPSRSGREQQGGVHQEQASCFRRLCLGLFSCWQCPTDIWCRCFNQCDRDFKLQGRSLPRQLDLLGQLRT